jgi:hypothetical protein
MRSPFRNDRAEGCTSLFLSCHLGQACPVALLPSQRSSGPRPLTVLFEHSLADRAWMPLRRTQRTPLRMPPPRTGEFAHTAPSGPPAWVIERAPLAPWCPPQAPRSMQQRRRMRNSRLFPESASTAPWLGLNAFLDIAIFEPLPSASFAPARSQAYPEIGPSRNLF